MRTIRDGLERFTVTVVLAALLTRLVLNADKRWKRPYLSHYAVTGLAPNTVRSRCSFPRGYRETYPRCSEKTRADLGFPSLQTLCRRIPAGNKIKTVLFRLPRLSCYQQLYNKVTVFFFVNNNINSVLLFDYIT